MSIPHRRCIIPAREPAAAPAPDRLHQRPGPGAGQSAALPTARCHRPRAVRRPRTPGPLLGGTARPGPAVLAGAARAPAAAAADRGVAVAELAERVAGAGAQARLKWPNDVLLDGRKIAGILVEGRPQQRWAVLGIGINVAVREHDLPPELTGAPADWGWSPRRSSPCWRRAGRPRGLAEGSRGDRAASGSGSRRAA